MDQEYERRLLKQINHQNLPRDTQPAQVRLTGKHHATLYLCQFESKLH